MRLRTIFDDWNFHFIAHAKNGIHVVHEAKKMRDHDGINLTLRKALPQMIEIHQLISAVDIYENGFCSDRHHGGHGIHAGICNGRDFGSSLYSYRPQANLESISSISDPDTEIRSDVIGERLLE